MKSRRIAVTLTDANWRTLTNFVVGDLHNMDESELKTELREIVEAIDLAVMSKTKGDK